MECLKSKSLHMCRICLMEPETDRSMKFFNIFWSNGSDEKLCRNIKELLSVNVERHDIKPKIVCDCCYKSLSRWSDLKQKAKESQIIIDYVIAKRYSDNSVPIRVNSTPDWSLDLTVDSPQPSTASTVAIDDDAVCEIQSDDSDDDVIMVSEESVETTEQACPAAVVPATVADDERKCADRRNTKSTRPVHAHRVRISSMVLFTCMKPACNVLTSSLKSFKSHCRLHLKIKHGFTCWKCVTVFPSVNELRTHQIHTECQKPAMFKCYECDTFYDNIQILSVHKLIKHECTVIGKHTTLRCPFCKIERNANTFRNHLIECRHERDNFVLYASPKKPDPYDAIATIAEKLKLLTFKCTHCRKICKTQSALTNHLKKHANEATKKRLNAKRTYKIIDRSANGKLTISTAIGDSSRSTDNVDGSLTPPEPEQFGAPFSLSDLWSGCSAGVGVRCTKSPKKPSPANYYCGQCKEYFTHAEFAQHMKTIHGQQVRSRRYRRYKCDQCQNRFIYKIALAMHREHVHGEVKMESLTAVVATPGTAATAAVGDNEDIGEFVNYTNDGSIAAEWNGIAENNDGHVGTEQNQVLLDEWEMYVSKIANEMINENNTTTTSADIFIDLTED